MEQLREATAPEILESALHTYRGRIALACSFGGASGLVVLDMAMKIDRDLPVYYLDTGLLFPQTYELVEKIAQRYGIAPIAVKPELSVDEQAERYGDMLWGTEPDRCCAMRKVEPQTRFLANFDAWISGVRRDQSSTRGELQAVTRDERTGTVKIAPLAGWTSAAVDAYVAEHEIPVNALHASGFPSIGCMPCTQRVAPGDDPRSGRWRGFAKTECGIHV